MEKAWKAIKVSEAEDIEPAHFFILEGPCKKCKVANNSLVIHDFKLNKIDNEQSIFRTICLNCSNNGIYYRRDVEFKS